MSVSVVTNPVSPTPKANCVCWVLNLSTVGTPGSTKVDAIIQVCDDAGNPIVLGGTDGIQIISLEAPGNFEICINNLVQHLIYAQSHNPAQVGTSTSGPSFPEPFISKRFKIRYGYLTSSQDPNNCTVPVQTWQGFTSDVVVTNAASQTYEWWAQQGDFVRPMAHLPSRIIACNDVPLLLTVWKSQGIEAPYIGWLSPSQGGDATTHVITPQSPGQVVYEITGSIDPYWPISPAVPIRLNVVWVECCCKSTFNNVRFISQRGGWMSMSFDCDAELGVTTEGQTICTVGKCLQLDNGSEIEPYEVWNTLGGDRQYNKKGRETITMTKKYVDQGNAVTNGKQEEYVKDFLFSPVHQIVWQSPYDPLTFNQPTLVAPELSARSFNLVYGSYVYSKRTSEFILTVQFESTHQRVIQKSAVR